MSLNEGVTGRILLFSLKKDLVRGTRSFDKEGKDGVRRSGAYNTVYFSICDKLYT